MEWTQISHTCQFPFYYVSYGVSMLGAISLAQEGPRAYERVIARRAGTPFLTTIGRDVLSEESVRSVAAWVERMADAWIEN